MPSETWWDIMQRWVVCGWWWWWVVKGYIMQRWVRSWCTTETRKAQGRRSNGLATATPRAIPLQFDCALHATCLRLSRRGQGRGVGPMCLYHCIVSRGRHLPL